MDSDSDSIIPVILAGGSGTRLWPLSTERRPKQFQAIAGAGSMFSQTLQRAADPARFSRPMIVASLAHRRLIEAELAAIGVSPAAIVLEPEGRNTAPAIVLAALLAQARGLGGMLMAMPSDHHVGEPEKLLAAIDLARRAAASGVFVTFGIAPMGPETSYGYIRRGATLGPGSPGVFAVARFTEKPARSTAEAMLAEGGYFWNSGMFLLPVGSLLGEMRRLKPELVEGAERALSGGAQAGPVIIPEASAFAALENISIDHALMESTSRAAVVPVDPAWSDIGSWTAVADIAPRDALGNTALGEVVLHDVVNAYVRSEGATTAVIGLSDIIVVNTGDAVIIARKDRAQDIRHVAEAIRKRNAEKAAARND